MGSILGGGSKSSGSSAINGAATNVANTAQAGGKYSSDAISQASKNAADAIQSGANWNANAAWQGAQTAAQGNLQGSQTAADAQRQAMEYLQQADKLPSGLREAALQSLGSLYGINYGADGTITNSGGSITDRAMASPFYQAAVQQGENSVLRNSAATGGLRSGTASENLAQVNQNALLSAYTDQVNGLQGLSALPSNANTIAAYQAGIGNTLGQGQMSYANTLGQGQIAYGQAIGQGQTLAGQTLAQGQISAADAISNSNNAAATALSQGQVAAAQNKAQASQNSANNTMGLVGLGLTAASFFSDRRLKDNIEFVGMENGHKKYRWDWNEIASGLGLSGSGHGVMADEVDPGAVSIRDGYMVVDYSKLGVSHGV